MNCIIIGLSNFGIMLAQRLTSMGHEVLGVDADQNKVNEYKDSIQNTIGLNINSEKAVLSLPLNEADIVFVAIRKDVGASVLAVATLKEKQVKRIVACSFSRLHTLILRTMGVSEIIQPELEYANYFALKMELATSVYSYMVSENYFIYEIQLPGSFVGRAFKDVQFEKEFGLKFIAVKRGEEHDRRSKKKIDVVAYPEEGFVIGKNDIFILAGPPRAFVSLNK
ncbi:MAG: TrkA family potassium uptake protein [Culturomica sp.]|jgi:trk system potassium uptake protein TrkA|nr:TrkA family potassium uptake protein [Culturomica sp.]